MGKNRLEAFSDGVLAIIITVMVLEMKTPDGGDLPALRPMLSVFLSYVLSYVYVGIYWNNHHHLLHATRHVSGAILWANLHLLFWLSLVPFTTAWAGQYPHAPWPSALYGIVLFMAGLAYRLLVLAITSHEGATSELAQAVGSDRKGNLSVVIYAAAIGSSFVLPLAGKLLYVVPALMWFIPDRRIEKRIHHE